MATLDPRLLLMLAVKVLGLCQPPHVMRPHSRQDLRKPRMRIGNLFRQEQAVTRNSLVWIKVWVGELSRSPETWVSGESQRYLVLLQVFLSERTSWDGM